MAFYASDTEQTNSRSLPISWIAWSLKPNGFCRSKHCEKNGFNEVFGHIQRLRRERHPRKHVNARLHHLRSDLYFSRFGFRSFSASSFLCGFGGVWSARRSASSRRRSVSCSSLSSSVIVRHCSTGLSRGAREPEGATFVNYIIAKILGSCGEGENCAGGRCRLTTAPCQRSRARVSLRPAQRVRGCCRAGLAQLVERRFCKPKVGGSSPSTGTTPEPEKRGPARRLSVSAHDLRRRRLAPDPMHFCAFLRIGGESRDKSPRRSPRFIHARSRRLVGIRAANPRPTVP